jgi:predicted amidohydrolase
MEGPMKVTAIQLNSQEDKELNLEQARRLILESHRRFPAELYVLPEYASFGGGTPEQKFAAAEQIPNGTACRFYSRLAAELATTIHCGSVNERDGGRMFNTSVVFDATGREICRYRKLFLFDATLPSGRELRESKLYSRGRDIVTFTLHHATFGCTMCYDLRFPELYRALRRRNADIMVFVGAISNEHGAAHLEVLLRARAIENQAYVIASQQCGRFFNNTRENYGNSMIVDPWGGHCEAPRQRARLHQLRARYRAGAGRARKAAAAESRGRGCA